MGKDVPLCKELICDVGEDGRPREDGAEDNYPRLFQICLKTCVNVQLLEVAMFSLRGGNEGRTMETEGEKEV